MNNETVERRIAFKPSQDHLSQTPRRLDIQGLRALAVVAVIAYHFNIGIPGGYLGVDIFFVISGFVVGGILLRELRARGRIDFKRFVIRRAFRLIPALSVMVATVAFVEFWIFLDPVVRGQVQSTAPSAILGISNFVIAQESGGYFAPDSARNPLLHTWSLSVEWQFYALMGVALALLATKITKRPSVLTIVLLLLSLASLTSMMFPVNLGFLKSQASSHRLVGHGNFSLVFLPF